MSQFVDEVRVFVRGGDGGNGCVSFRREAHVPYGGPDGGDGGNGADVIFIASRSVVSLLAFKDFPHRIGDSGKHGVGKKKSAVDQPSLIVNVPIGTQIKDESGELVADLTQEGDQFLAAYGGVGGRGNARFLNNSRRAPSFCEIGEKGQDTSYYLTLKLLADVALVGFPNVGKSTLISVISSAKPKIADYPFTTLTPNLGVVKTANSNLKEYIVADIPGLIEGAAQGKGLGHQFLRHIERALVVALMIDLSIDFIKEYSVKSQIEKLLFELEQYNPDLIDRPRIIIGTKKELSDESILKDFDNATKDSESIIISSVLNYGIPELIIKLGEIVANKKLESQTVNDSYVLHKPEPKGFVITKSDDGAFIVHGRKAERAVSVNDLENLEGLAFVQEKLQKIGVEKALKRAGVKSGDTVVIANFVFDFQE